MDNCPLLNILKIQTPTLLNIVKILYVIKDEIQNLKYLGSKLHLIGSIMLTYSSSGFGHWTR